MVILMARKSSLYRVAEIFALISGIVGIVLTVLGFFEITLGEGWFYVGGFGEELYWAVLAIVFSVLVLLVGIGSMFTDIDVIILGVLVIIFSLFIPGIAGVLGLVSGILFIVDGVQRR